METSVLPDQITHLIEVVNRGDTDSFISFFASDGCVNDWGTKYEGSAEIRTWSDREFIGAQVTLSVLTAERQGVGVSILAKVSGSGFNGPSRFTFLMRGGKVQEMRITES